MAKIDANRKKLLLIFALFIIPLSAATIWYSLLPEGYRPSKTTNNGDLISPAHRLEAFQEKTLAGKTYSGANLEKIWTVVHLLDAPCDEACSKRLYDTRQMRIALGKDIDRVQRLIVVSTPELAKSQQKMWDSHPDLAIVIAAKGGLSEQIRQLSQDQVNTVYLIDPLGNLMMKFAPALETKLMMKDIQKLLRLSHIG